MISFTQAYNVVVASAKNFGWEIVPLGQANGRVLDEDVFADRDFPPFNRATKDGIAINIDDKNTATNYQIEGIAAAGSPQQTLTTPAHCLEIMTGAVLPKNSNTVVMYEDISIANGIASLTKAVKKGQNIHAKGSDEPKGSKVLNAGIRISAAEIGVLAAVGKAMVRVKKMPRVCLFSTGDELVSVDQTPLPHQIRQSNAHTLKAALADLGIDASIQHITDNKAAIKTALENALAQNDVLLISGGVSKGKFDYLPTVLDQIGVQKHFHRVKQRPGKPFWFGKQEQSQCCVFGFPGNPASTFANFHLYFRPWLQQCLGLPQHQITVTLQEAFTNNTGLSRFIRAKVSLENGQLKASFILGNGSGDLTSLSKANGFIQVDPEQHIATTAQVTFIPTRAILW